MNVQLRSVVLRVALIAAFSAIAASAVTLDPVFRLTQIQGACQVRRPDDSAFSPAEDGRAYPYGTRIRTGADSTAVIVMAEENTCRILANANLVLTEAETRTHKRLLLDAGEVEIRLTEGFHTNGNKLDVETATSIATPEGTHFRVAVQFQEDLLVVIIRCLDGSLRVYGRVFGFLIETLARDQWVSLISPSDHSFLRLKNLKGTYRVRIPEGDGLERVIETTEGVTLKIWQQEIPDSDMIAVSVAITDKDGRLLETVVATIPRGPRLDYPDDDENGVPPKHKKQADFSDVVTTTTTTTTTTIPSPTPVGRR